MLLHRPYLKPLFLLIALLASLPATAARYDDDVRNFVSSSGVPEGSLALLVTDLSDGSTLCSFNESKPLIPASIMKTVTIASLLEKVGPDWCYVTKVYTSGHMKQGTLHGDLIVEGAGDPSVNCSSEPESPDIIGQIINALKEKKVTQIEGTVIVDNSLFPGPATPPSWASGDLPHAYGTGCHAFNFRSNASGKSAVKDPADVFKRTLISTLSASGISVGGSQADEGGRHLLLEHRSAPIDEIMRSCMMRSDNLFAEAMLRTYAHVCGRRATPTEGAALELAYWKKQGLPVAGVEILDGSGLSRSDRMTAIFLGGMLAKMSSDVIYASFFPLAGQEGTLKKFLAGTPLDSYIALKTGSMSGIQCYAGYKLDDDYVPTHVVVVMANNMPDRTRLRSALQTLLMKIFD